MSIDTTNSRAARQIVETSGPTTLDIAGIADTQFLKRSGTTIVGAAAVGGGAPSAFSYVGNDVIGASNESNVSNQIYCRKITAPSNGIILNIQAYMASPADNNQSNLSVAVYADNADAPGKLRAYLTHIEGRLTLESALATPDPRWLRVPINCEVLDGVDYWLGIMSEVQATASKFYYDVVTGATKAWVATDNFFTDGGFNTTIATINKDYSIRALFLPTA